MNCYKHSETPAVGFCRACGRGLCAECKRQTAGTIYCEDHAPAQPAAMPVAAAAPAQVSPGLAFFLGLIPGVGAIYNGQYGKGLIHAVITGLLISIIEAEAGDVTPLLAFVLMAWWLYMPLEAYHTARKRLAGEPVDEFSSLVNMRSATSSRFPTGAVLLIALGTLLLLNTLEILRFRHIIRWWPALLIAVGVYMLYLRISGDDPGRRAVEPAPGPRSQEIEQ
jgi:TM2 domain-containing membrane protein YozV